MPIIPPPLTCEISVVIMPARRRAGLNSFSIFRPTSCDVDAGAMMIVLSPPGSDKICDTLVE